MFEDGATLLTTLALTFALLGVSMTVLGNRAQSRESRRRDAARLATIDRKLDAVMRHLGIEEPTPEHPEVLLHLAQGRKIQAIKAYRDQTGAPLAEAKTEVERLARAHGLNPH